MMDWVLLGVTFLVIVTAFLAFWVVRLETKLDKILWLLRMTNGKDDDE